MVAMIIVNLWSLFFSKASRRGTKITSLRPISTNTTYFCTFSKIANVNGRICGISSSTSVGFLT